MPARRRRGPDGSASASPTARSITETSRAIWPSERAGQAQRASAASAPRAGRTRASFGRISVLRSTSWNGVGTCWLTTRIISSGVTPLAVSAATNEPGARAHVDVELVDGAVHRQQVERSQGADLVDAAGEPAAAQHQRGARAPRPAALRLAGCLAVLLRRLLEPDDLAHPADEYRRKALRSAR